MDRKHKRLGTALAALVVALTVFTGAAARLTTRAEAPAGLPALPADYLSEPEEHFDAALPAWTMGGRYDCAPLYNNADDPGWPAALYAPGLPLTVTGRKWREEHSPAISAGATVWLEVDILRGEAISRAWIPDVFVSMTAPEDPSLPNGTLRAESGTYVGLYTHLTDETPADSLSSGLAVSVLSYQPGWWQIQLGETTGYVREAALSVSDDIRRAFAPAFLEGFDRWRLGCIDYYDGYYDWFDRMCSRYGSHDFWPNELKALDTGMKIKYGLIEKGDTAFYIPEETDLGEASALEIARKLIGDDGTADENGIPRYAWQAYFRADYGVSEEPYWWLRAWTASGAEDWVVRLDRRTGEPLTDPKAYSAFSGTGRYHEIAMSVLYGEQRYQWPMFVRRSVFPDEYPPLEPGQPDEDTVKRLALEAFEAAYGPERRQQVEEHFQIYADYANHGKLSAEDPEDRVFWTVRFINLTPGEVEEITVSFSMDGEQMGSFIDDFYGDGDNYEPGGNG